MHETTPIHATHKSLATYFHIFIGMLFYFIFMWFVLFAASCSCVCVYRLKEVDEDDKKAKRYRSNVSHTLGHSQSVRIAGKRGGRRSSKWKKVKTRIVCVRTRKRSKRYEENDINYLYMSRECVFIWILYMSSIWLTGPMF